MELAGRRAIVTGAAVGLGNAYARALAGQGVHLALCDMRDDIHQVAADLDSAGLRALAWQGDVASPQHVREVVDGAGAALGGVDILINNAGAWGSSLADDGLDKSLDDYERLVGANLKGAWLFGRAVMPLMIRQGSGGDIINIATDHIATCGTPRNLCPRLDTCPWGDQPRPVGGGQTMDLYDAAKWGLNGFLYGWAKALAPHNIRVNALCMGATDSLMLRSFYNFDPPREEVDKWMKKEDNARVMIDILKEGPSGRNARNVNFCMGRPVRTEPPGEHLYVMPEDVRLACVP